MIVVVNRIRVVVGRINSKLLFQMNIPITGTNNKKTFY